MYNQFGQQQNFGMYPQGGMQYNQLPQAKMTQVLTPEQIKQLRTTSSQFSLQVDPIEVTRSLCTHKDQGKIALLGNDDGSVTCSVCGARFKLIESEIAQVQEITSMFIDVLQSIKTYYVDIPESYVTEYFKMIPLLEKVPKFFELASNNFRKYEHGDPYRQNNEMNGFNLFNAIAGPGVMNPMAYQQPMYQQPIYQNQAPQGYNPFASNGYMPQEQQMQQQPQQQMQQQPQDQSQQQNQGQQNIQTTKMFNL